jgi:hypothetical protein
MLGLLPVQPRRNLLQLGRHKSFPSSNYTLFEQLGLRLKASKTCPQMDKNIIAAADFKILKCPPQPT